MESDLGKLPKLKGTKNWNLWKESIQTVVESYNLLDVLKGDAKCMVLVEADNDDAKKAAKEKLIREWNVKDAKVRKYLLLSISETPAAYITGIKTSYKQWEKLCSVYENKGDEARFAAEMV